jgi:hypothetical protein
MTRRSTLYVRWLVAIALALLAPSLVIAAGPAVAKQLRLKISLEVRGAWGPVTDSRTGDTLKSSIDDSYNTEELLPAEADMGPQKTNPLDPASAKEIQDYQARAQAHADKVYHSADDLRGRSATSNARPSVNPATMDPAAMQAMMAKVKACGNDQTCKQQVAMEMMAQQMPSGPNAQVSSQIQAISNMCINEKRQPVGTKGYQDCIEAEGRKRSTRPPSADDDEPEVAELEDRYLYYRGVEGCTFKGHTQINTSSTTAIPDVGGMRIQGASFKGEGDDDPKAYPKGYVPCLNNQAIFDLKTNTFWMQGFPIAAIAVTAVQYSNGKESGRSTEQVREVRVLTGGADQELGEWIRSSLLGVPASGSKTQKFGDKLTAKLSWSFVRE